MSATAADLEQRLSDNALSEQDAVGKIKGILSPEPPAPEETTDDTEAVEDLQDSPEGDVEALAEDAPEGVDELTIDAEQLGQMLGIDGESFIVDDDGISLRTKVDGQEGKATLKELLKNYQYERHLNDRSQEIAASKKQYDESLAQLNEAINQTQQQSETLYQAFEKELLAPYESVDWKEMKELDPGGYAAARADYRDMQDRLKAKKGEVMQALQEQQQKAMQTFQEQYRGYLGEQRELLHKFHPNWNDDTQKSVSNYLKSRGFSDEEVSRVADARLVSMAHDAMLYNQGKTNAQTKLKKPLPKILKTGQKGAPKAAAAAQAIEKAQAAFRDNPTVENAVALAKAKNLFGKE